VFCTLCGGAPHYSLVRPASEVKQESRLRERFVEARLPPGAEILEAGSHLGAYLKVAENWGSKPIGLDIGRDGSAFARRQGRTVKPAVLEIVGRAVDSPSFLIRSNK
jgi:hypothetical protein